MAEVNAAEIPEEMKFMADFWSFRKKFYKGEEQDEFWTSLIECSDELSKKYNSLYLDQLILICVDDIDRRYMTSINKPWKSDPLEEVYNRLQRNRGKKT